MPQDFICEWINYFEKLLTLDQERFELEILIFFEECNYDWNEIEHKIEGLPNELKLRIIERIEKMRENTIRKMTKSVNVLFLTMTMLIALVALFIAFFIDTEVAIHFGAIGMLALLLLTMAGILWVQKK